MTAQLRIVAIEPSIFFAHSEGSADAKHLRQLVRVILTNDGAAADAHLEVRLGEVADRIRLGAIEPGTASYDVYLPDVRQPVEGVFRLYVGEALQDERAVAWVPERHWEVHLVHYAHHDRGYTDLPSNVMAEYDGFMDQALEFCQRTENWPWESRFRYLIEQAWSAVHYLENRPPEAAERLGRYLRNGQIELTALFGNQTSELCGHEEMIRLLYPSFRIKRELGAPIVSAEHNDIPGFSWGLCNVLAGAGVRYFSPGIPLWYFGRGEGRVHPMWDEKQVLDMEIPGAFWWEGIDGSRLLLWYDLHGGEWQPTSYGHALRELPELLAKADNKGYQYDLISYTVRGGHRDNAPLTDRYCYIVRQWNERWAYPRLVNSTNAIFLGEFEKRYGSQLRTLRGECPGTDYPAAATCTPKETALDKNVHDWLLAAEKLATLGTIHAGYGFPKTTLERAYRETFYYDLHCWGMHDPGGPAQDAHWSEKGATAYRAAALAHDILLKAANKIADEISYPEDGYYITVFNPLSWQRNDVVRVPARAWSPCGMPMHWQLPQREGDGPVLVAGTAVGRSIIHPPLEVLEEPFALIDVSTGKAVPYQVSTLNDPQAPEPWAPEKVALSKVDRRAAMEIVFMAEDLPAMGYKTYRLEPVRRWPRQGRAAGVTRHGLENDFYRVVLEPGTGRLISLYDKELGRELLDSEAPHPCARPLARSLETGKVDAGRVTKITVGEGGSMFSTLIVKGETTGCPRWTQEIRLYHRIKRLDVNTRILRDSTPTLEVYLGFPFRVDNPRFLFESCNTIIEPTVDQLPGSNTDYYATQHWARVQSGDGGWGITLTPLDTPML